MIETTPKEVYKSASSIIRYLRNKRYHDYIVGQAHLPGVYQTLAEIDQTSLQIDYPDIFAAALIHTMESAS